MRRLVVSIAVLVATLGLVSGCGEDTPATDAGDVETIDITFEAGTVSPNAERVEVGVGQPVDLVVRADEPGEIHVHTEPEQEFAYAPGTTTLKLQIDQPGVVEVESHDLEQVIVQLEVS